MSITLGMKLKQLRKSQGLNQDQVAEYLNCQRQAVSMWERDQNRMTTENLEKLARLFNIEISYLKYDEQNLGALLEYRLVNEMGVRNLTEEEKNEIADKMIEIYKIIK